MSVNANEDGIPPALRRYVRDVVSVSGATQALRAQARRFEQQHVAITGLREISAVPSRAWGYQAGRYSLVVSRPRTEQERQGLWGSDRTDRAVRRVLRVVNRALGYE